MVIHCDRLDQIPFILWGDIHDLSQILHSLPLSHIYNTFFIIDSDLAWNQQNG
jgi:hypothetical protein